MSLGGGGGACVAEGRNKLFIEINGSGEPPAEQRRPGSRFLVQNCWGGSSAAA